MRRISDNIRFILAGIFAIEILFGLASCDPASRYDYWIQNNSDLTVYVYYTLSDTDTITCQRLMTGQEFQLVRFETRGRLKDAGLDYMYENCDSLAIYSDSINKILIKKDSRLRENWTYEQEKTSLLMNSGYIVYRFTINNIDVP